MSNSSQIHATTILAVHHQGRMAFAGDGQVTLQNTIFKHGANKIRSLRDETVLAGFAGSAADAFTLFERFEKTLSSHGGQLARAAVELAKDWRLDKYLRRLEAMLVVGDLKDGLFVLSGGGDVIQPDDGVVGIGSGGTFALAAARGILRVHNESIEAKTIVAEAMAVAADICPFTNSRIQIRELFND